MLKLRLISAAVMMPLVVYIVLRFDTRWFALVLALLLCMALWEWLQLVPLHSLPARCVAIAVSAALMLLAWRVTPELVLVPVLVASCAWWLFALFWLSRPALCAEPGASCSALKLLAGLLVSLPPWIGLVVLHRHGQQGPQLVLALLVMIWVADSGAYFAGRRFGRHKLAPSISPGKTREGLYGGLLASLLFAMLAGWWFSHSVQWTASYCAVAVTAVLFSVAGDLLESLMKRQSGTKDSGSLIPGHGGIFDRIDSLVAAVPVFMSGYLWLGL